MIWGLVVDSGKAFVGLRPVFFGPCTLGRTWGTRPKVWMGLFLFGSALRLTPSGLESWYPTSREIRARCGAPVGGCRIDLSNVHPGIVFVILRKLRIVVFGGL